MPPAYLRRIEIQLLGNFVEMNFQRVTRLRRAVTAFGPTRWFIGKDPGALEFISRDLIRDCLQRAGVEGTRHAVAAVCATIEKSLEVHSGNRAVVFHTGLNVHQNGVAATMTIENLFTSERA